MSEMNEEKRTKLREIEVPLELSQPPIYDVPTCYYIFGILCVIEIIFDHFPLIVSLG